MVTSGRFCGIENLSWSDGCGRCSHRSLTLVWCFLWQAATPPPPIRAQKTSLIGRIRSAPVDLCLRTLEVEEEGIVALIWHCKCARWVCFLFSDHMPLSNIYTTCSSLNQRLRHKKVKINTFCCLAKNTYKARRECKKIFHFVFKHLRISTNQ